MLLFLSVSLALFICTSSQISDDIIRHPPPLPIVPSYVYCNTTQRSRRKCTTEEQVCGFRPSGLPTTFKNGCFACRSPNVFAYLPASCSNNLQECPKTRKPIAECTSPQVTHLLSCGFEKDTMLSSLGDGLCCQGTTYSSRLLGICPDIPIKKCRRSVRGPCTRRQAPVCAVFQTQKIQNNFTTSITTKKTYSNECQACIDKPVHYYEGKCPP